MTVAEQRACFRAWLRARVGDVPISFVETHLSILAMTDERVWKLKKAVRFPFVDLSTPESRRRNADREVALNRRFAPDVYLDVVPLEAGGVVVDWIVEMRRMPDARRLTVVAGGPGGPACVDRIGRALSRLHAAAPMSGEIDRVATRTALSELWRRNLDEVRPFAGTVFDPDRLARVERAAARYLDGRGPLFARRIAEGRVRDGHGDLLADDVFCLDDAPRFLDCLEFDDKLRYGDVLGDVAFLAMDLEQLGHRELADRLLDAYRLASGDAWPASLADLYVAYRALVRAKVACLRAASEGTEGVRAAHDVARRLLSLAAERLAHGRIRLILVGGPPASGKTTLARELRARTGWSVLSSDTTRKRLAGLDPATPAAADLDAGLYTPEWNARTYDALLREAEQFLGYGESVILDASWHDTSRRDEAARVAARTSSDLSAFVLGASAAVAEARARARASAGADASDATASVATALRARSTPWPEAFELDGEQPAGVLAVRVLERLDSGQ